jgi:hypothetical protein
LNVFDAPAASDAPDHVKVQWLPFVTADEPLPFSGLSFAPEGTLSFVQCAPEGRSKSTAKLVIALEPLVTVIVPQ